MHDNVVAGCWIVLHACCTNGFTSARIIDIITRFDCFSNSNKFRISQGIEPPIGLPNGINMQRVNDEGSTNRIYKFCAVWVSHKESILNPFDLGETYTV